MSLEHQVEAAPATPATGYLRQFYDTTQKALKWIDEWGFAKTFSGLLGLTTTSISSTTTAETKSLVGTIIGTFTVKANSSIIGRGYRIKARGVITTGITAGTITFQLKWAGTVIASTGAVAPTVSQSNMYWDLEADVVVRTIGGTGTLFVQGHIHLQNATTPAAGVRWPVRGNSADPPAAVTVDTTADALIDLQSITSNNLHTITCNMVRLETMN